ncbi:MAG TPA: VOC family protein [Acidimicrobiales bacterium]|nr:VOC family protein [Acidimicrobiales bacterium]
MISGLRQVVQRADDLDRAVAFYRDTLGLALIARFDPPGLAFFDLGNTRLLLERGEHGSLIYLHVDDVKATSADLAAKGVAIEGEPHVIFDDADGTFGPAGQTEWLGFFRDSEDNLVGLMSRG